MTTCTSISTPMASHAKLDLDSKGIPVDQILYRSMIGSLIFLAASRPNIMFATCLCVRFQA